jgi:hypothetical protein
MGAAVLVPVLVASPLRFAVVVMSMMLHSLLPPLGPSLYPHYPISLPLAS